MTPAALPGEQTRCRGVHQRTIVCRSAPTAHPLRKIATCCATSWCDGVECQRRYTSARVRAARQYLGAEPFVSSPWLHTFFTIPASLHARVDERIAARMPLAAWRAWCVALRAASPEASLAEGDLGGIGVLHPAGRDGTTWKPHVHVMSPALAVHESGGVDRLRDRVNLDVLRWEWTRFVCSLIGEPLPSKPFYVRVRVFGSPEKKARLLPRELRGFPGWRVVSDNRVKQRRAGRHLLSLRTFGIFSARTWSSTRKLLSVPDAPPRRGPVCRHEDWDGDEQRPVECGAPMVPLNVMPWSIRVAFASARGSPIEPEERAYVEHRYRCNGLCNCVGCVEIDGFVAEWRTRRARSVEPLGRVIVYLSALASTMSWRECGNPFAEGGPMLSVAPLVRYVLGEFLADEFDLTFSVLLSGFRPPGPQTLPSWRLREMRQELEAAIAQLDVAGVVLGDVSLSAQRRASWRGDFWSLAALLWPSASPVQPAVTTPGSSPW